MKTFETSWGGRPLIIETGKMAKQANGSVLVRYGETVVLVTATASKNPLEGADFLPLTVKIMLDRITSRVARRKKNSG